MCRLSYDGVDPKSFVGLQCKASVKARLWSILSYCIPFLLFVKRAS